jgi:hypothetical protein
MYTIVEQLNFHFPYHHIPHSSGVRKTLHYWFS